MADLNTVWTCLAQLHVRSQGEAAMDQQEKPAG
jgi:hypothetical protein